MRIESYPRGKYTVIRIYDVLNLTSNIEPLEEMVTDLLKRNRKNIAIAFADGSYLCSRSGATIIRCWEAIKEVNGTFTLLNVNKDIRDFLAVIDLETIIQILDSEEELNAQKTE